MLPAIYIGVSARNNKTTNIDNVVTDYVMYLHDGFNPIDSCLHSCMNFEDMLNDIYKRLLEYRKSYKIVMMAYDDIMHFPNNWLSKLWSDLDILPISIKIREHVTPEEAACSAVRKALQFMSPVSVIPTVTNVQINYNHQVEVDGNGHIQLTVLEDYRKFLDDQDWNELLDLARLSRENNWSILFFNSTPRGGGVALMRHAMIRLFRLLNVNVSWYVMKPDPKVFEITKRKFHNVLQGVEEESLSDKDIEVYEAWCRRNVQYWTENSIKTDLSYIVIDDPQPCGIIPYMKKLYPDVYIIYRNHIQMDIDKIDNQSTVAHKTFMYLFDNYIQYANMVVNHPLPLPRLLQNYPIQTTIPATTDPLDGLNKKLYPQDIEYYNCHFERICVELDQPIPPVDVPWIVQIARFDPSKGISDVIKSFVSMKNTNVHLIITGHGSIDDPESIQIFNQVNYETALLKPCFRKRITILKLPPCDQLLNFVLSNAKIALQLSHREGFEIKVTESIMKGVPVIVYDTGGMPQQVQHGETGFVVRQYDTEQVTNLLDELLSNDILYQTLVHNCLISKKYYKYYLTPYNCLRWLRVWKQDFDKCRI